MTKTFYAITFLLLSNGPVRAQSTPADTSLEDRIRYLQADVRSMKANQVAAGRRLSGYTSLFYSGLAMQVLGSFLIVTEANRIEKTSENPSFICYAGFGLGVVGAVVQIASHGKIGAAGKYLTGNGFVVPLRSKRGQTTPAFRRQ